MNTRDEEEFRKASEKIKKQWGGEIEKEPDANLSQDDIFDMIDAGDVARQDIESEFGDDEFMPMDDDEYKNLMRDLDEDVVDNRNLLQPSDSEGNPIKKNMLVKPAGGIDKKGRVVRFGDNGSGSLIVKVDWAWPTEMKFTNPEEMGEKDEAPESLLVQSISEDVISETAVDSTWSRIESIKGMLGIEMLFDEIIRKMDDGVVNQILDVIERENELSQSLEEMRGLGHGVKNSGDRNVKLRDDHKAAPLTNLNESINKKIKTLSESKITKKGLLDFIKQEAKSVAKNIKNN